jgi:predicted RNase H-like nuclease (RuvC/YqgF family)
MGTSYSKLRHIQEANLRLEQQRLDEQNRLINTIGSKIKGAVAGAQTTMRNITGKGGSFRESPKLANILAQMKNRAKAMNQQISYFGTEFQNLEQEVNTLKTKNPAYAAEADRLMEIVKKYQLAMQAAYEAGGVFLRESGEYKQGQPAQVQPAQPAQVQPAQPTQQNLSPEEQTL